MDQNYKTKKNQFNVRYFTSLKWDFFGCMQDLLSDQDKIVPCDLMGKLRREQQKMIQEEDVQEHYNALAHSMCVRSKVSTRTKRTKKNTNITEQGSICPPWPDLVDSTSRINFHLFWSMAQLLQQITNTLKKYDNKLKTMSDDSIVELFEMAPTESNARDHPIYEALENCLMQQVNSP